MLSIMFVLLLVLCVVYEAAVLITGIIEDYKESKKTTKTITEPYYENGRLVGLMYKEVPVE